MAIDERLIGQVHSCGRVITAASGCSPCRVQQRRERVQRAIDLLGRACVRCGVTEPLHLDHVLDDGYRNKTAGGNYRRVMHAEGAEISRILTTGRSDRLQLLCPNCNHLKHHNRQEFDRAPIYGMLLTDEARTENPNPLFAPAGPHPN